MKKIVFKDITFKNFHPSDFSNIVKKNGLFVFPAGPALANFKLHSNYHKALIKSDYVFFDSGYFVLLLRFLKKIKVKKFSGYLFLKLLFNYLKRNKKNKIFLINPNLKSSKINNEYLDKLGLKNRANYEAPIYNNKSVYDFKLLKIINENRPNFIIINLAGGIQEVLGYFIKKKIKFKSKIICTGGAISYFTGEQAPINNFIDKLYLGWLYRIFFNPKIFLTRYFNSLKLYFFVKRSLIKIIS